MDRAGIDIAVICSIATKPAQFKPILDWSASIRGKRIVPLPSVHPLDDQMVGHLKIIHEEGFKGIKLHPYYQDFRIDEERLFPLYETCRDLGLLVVCHPGFDISFPRDRIADPEKIARICALFPGLKFISTHYGSWDDWDEVEKHLIGKPVFMENSFSLQLIPRDQALRMYSRHPAGYLLFGTDSPWTEQSEAIGLLKDLDLDPDLLDRILFRNAAKLLEIS
jgi:uncharacterized protein